MIHPTLCRSLLLTTAAAAQTVAAQNTMHETAPAPRPNILFILADDLGYGDLGCYGQRLVPTPHIDSLAAAGLRFTQCYSGTTVSAPSRSCLLTGTHSGHTPVRGNVELQPEGQYPLPEGSARLLLDLKRAGYATGVFGKWGLGFIGSTGDPARQGVDRFYGYNCQLLAHSYYPDHLWSDAERVELADNTDATPYGAGTYAPDLIHAEALRFLDEQRPDRPFLLFYPTTIPHAELIVPEDSLALYFRGRFEETPYRGCDSGPGFRRGGYCSQPQPRATFAAMVARLDRYVGELVARLRERGLADNTLIIFASDNGPHLEGGSDPDFFDSNGPLRGYKRDLYEGGIRVPMIAAWPGRIAPGRTTDHICAFWDLPATLAELAGVPAACAPDAPECKAAAAKRTPECAGKCPKAAVPENSTTDTPCPGDGISLRPLLEGRPEEQAQHDFLYFGFLELGGRQAVRCGRWKLLHLDIRSEAPRWELYDLESDPGEEHDLAARCPERVAELRALMRQAHAADPAWPLLKDEKGR